MNRRYRTLISNSLVFAIGSLGSKVLLFFLVPIYTNTLGIEEYGDADLIVTIGDILLPIISLTIYDAMLPYGLQKGVKKENVFLNVNVVWGIGCILLMAMMPLFNLYLPIAQWKWYMYAYIVGSYASTNMLLYLKVKEKNKEYAILAIVQALILTATNIFLLCYKRLGIEGYLLSLIVSRFATALMAFFVSKSLVDLRKARFDIVLLKDMLRYSIPLIANAVSWWVINSSDKMMIEWFGNSTELGLYTAATKIPSFLNIITSIFSQAWTISSIKEYGENGEREFFTRVFKYYFVLVFGAGMILNMFIKPIMSVYVGAEFIQSWRTVPLLMISAMLAAFSSFLGAMYGAFRKSKNVMYTTVLGGIVNVGLNLLLIPSLGGMGAAIGTLVSYFVIVLVRMIDVSRETRIDYSLKIFIPMLILILVHGIIVTCNMMPILVSVVVIVIFFLLVRKDLREFLDNWRKHGLFRRM